MQAIGARGRLQTAEDYRQTEGIKGRLHSHGTHAQRYDTHAETDWGRIITGFATPPKTSMAIISGTGKATNFQFCIHIYRLNRHKSPLRIS